MDEQNKSPVSEGALIRTLGNKSLCNACMLLVTHDIAESNIYAPLSIASLRRDLELALNPESHIGRTNAPTLLANLVDAGFVSQADEMWLYEFADIVADEGELKIDPLLEACRLVLERKLNVGGRHG